MINILYFLEDRGHEGFIKSLVSRIAREEGIKANHIIRTATGGKPRALKQFRQFIRDLLRGSQPVSGLLIVAIDGNCNVNKVNQEITKCVGSTRFRDSLVCCVPDPHIERWYLLDLGALKKAVGSNISVSLPGYKCKKEFYKERLSSVVKPIGSLLGGPEYGEDIANNLRYDTLIENDKGFAKFIYELRTKLRSSR